MIIQIHEHDYLVLHTDVPFLQTHTQTNSHMYTQTGMLQKQTPSSKQPSRKGHAVTPQSLGFTGGGSGSGFPEDCLVSNELHRRHVPNSTQGQGYRDVGEVSWAEHVLRIWGDMED